MILDVEPTPKSPTSSGPTVRQAPGPSAPRSYATFPETVHGTQERNHGTGSETRPLLYQPIQALYDDVEPPAYDEINTPAKTSATRNRFWTRFAAIFLVILLAVSAFFAYDFNKIRRSNPSPNIPERPSPPATPTKGPSRPSPSPPPSSPSSPPHSPPPLPPMSPSPDPSTAPFIPPIKGRTDLCRPWAYSAKPGVRPTFSDNQPIDKLVYTVPTLAPIHLETSAICLTSKGTSEFCENYDDTYDSISGKLQVVGADVELPRIDVTIQHGSQDGLDDTAVCLMKKPDESGKDRWVLGLYVWKDLSTNDRNGLLASMSIIVTLPSSRIHNLSTRLNYFVQAIGPEIRRDSNALTFDTLEARLGERGSLSVRNVTAATIKTQAYGDAQWIQDTNVTKSVQIQSDSGLIACLVRLVQTEGSPPVRLDVQSEIGSVSARTILEYPPTSRTPRFDINMFSRFSPAMLLVHDPQGTSRLRQNPHLVPDTLPIILVNATSHLSIAQAVIPATYQGGLSLSSKHAAIVAIDHAKDLHGRTISWDKPTSQGYRGAVQWAGRSHHDQTGFVSVATEYAAARLLFLGLDDDDISNWPEGGDTITLGRLP